MKEKALLSAKSPITGIRWKWFGGHGLHGYYKGEEVGLANVGDFSKESLTYGKQRKKWTR